MHELFTKIHDIVDNAVSKPVCNTAYILVYLFNSASTWHCSVGFTVPLSSQFRDTVLPCEAHHYGYINWSIGHAQQQSSLGWSQTLTSVRGSKARLKATFPV